MPDDFVLSPRVQAARNVVARSPTVVPSPFGEAIAASSERLVDMFLAGHRLQAQRERLQLSRERLEATEERRDFLQAMDRAELLVAMSEPGVPLGEQSGFIRNGLSDVFKQDVANNPELANLIPRPLDPRDRLIQMRLNTIDRWGSSDNPDQQEAARLLRERTLLDGETIAEAREAQSGAVLGTLINQRMFELARRVAGETEEPATEADRRLWRNLIAEQTGTPFQIDVSAALGMEPGTLVVPEPIASTTVSKWLEATIQGQEDSSTAISELTTDINESLERMGLEAPVVSRQIATAAVKNDLDALEQLAGRSPEARAAVSMAIQGKRRLQGFIYSWLDKLKRQSPAVGAYMETFLGELRAFREAGASREELLEIAKAADKRARRVAELDGVDPDSIPGLKNPSAWVDIATGATIFGGGGLMLGAGTTAGVGALPLGLAGMLVGGVAGAAFGGEGVDIQTGPVGAERTPTLEETFARIRGSVDPDSAQAPAPDEGPAPQYGEPGSGSPRRVNALTEAYTRIRDGEITLREARQEYDLTGAEIREIGGLLREDRERSQ